MGWPQEKCLVQHSIDMRRPEWQSAANRAT
jgi:hypothetical protein